MKAAIDPKSNCGRFNPTQQNGSPSMPFNFTIRTERMAIYNHEPNRSEQDMTPEGTPEEKQLWCTRCQLAFPHSTRLGAVCSSCGCHLGS